MDVRCDRCQTEYELDDDSVSEGGASVQCTTCGHTFVVGPDGVTIAQIVPTTPPAGMADIAGPQAADWLLATEDGQTHRFRDLTTLQKWVVERKATREDRVSQRGGSWLPLGEVDELAPFFDVVDQADRARSAGLPADRTRRSAPRGSEGVSSRATPTRPTAVSRAGGARRRANGLGAEDALSARLDSAPHPSLEGDDFPTGEEKYDEKYDEKYEEKYDEKYEEKFDTMTIFRKNRGLKIAGGAGFVALALVAGVLAFRHQQAGSPKAVEAATAAAPRAVDSPPVPVPVAPVAPAPAAPPAPAAAVPARVAVAPVPAPVSAAKAPAGERANADLVAPGRPRTYERLVSDADRLMENGQPVRAQKLLDEALILQPNGVAALSGVAYLYLDRQKPLAAISTFKRALGYSPEFAPALFGLGEAYRAQGQIGPAVENYRKYIGVAPGGPDAPAARRQIKEIESLMPKRPPPEAPAAKENAKTDESSPSPGGGEQAKQAN